MRANCLFVVCLVVLFFSCKRSTGLSVADGYKLFNLEKVGWRSKSVTQTASGISYTATVVPIQYYILKQSGDANSQAVDSIYTSHKTERIIEMQFSHGSGDDLLKSKYTNKDYDQAVRYMSFHLEKDFVAITGKKDTIPCSGMVFERNFQLAPYKKVLLHFANIPEEETIQLLYHDQLFDNGTLKFEFIEPPLKL